MYKGFLLSFLVFLTWNCQPETTNKSNNTPTTTATEQPKEEPVERLRREAKENEDFLTLVKRGWSVVDENLKASAQVVPGLQGVTTEINRNCDVIVTTAARTVKFNLQELDDGNNAFRLMPDEAPGDLPGFAVRGLDAAPLVTIIENGKEIQAQEWEVYMKDRQAIEKSIPALVQTIRICKGTLRTE